MKAGLLALVLSLAGASAATAAPERFVLDSGHSQVVFSYDHLGYSTTHGMFGGFNGIILFDPDNPAASSVRVEIPVKSLFTGWEQRYVAFMSPQFFNDDNDDKITFVSTAVEVTGAETGRITGDLTINGITRSVVLDTRLNRFGAHPMAGRVWAGFNATTTLKRSDFNMTLFVPDVGDEIDILISIEAAQID